MPDHALFTRRPSRWISLVSAVAVLPVPATAATVAGIHTATPRSVRTGRRS
jgi:hypothetical protein